MEGALPENAVPVHSFAVGYGEVAAADEEGVTALPMVTVLTNDGKGPMLLLSLDSAPRLIAELTEAVPKSLARFDPDFVAQMAKADEVIERTKRAMRRQERNTFLGYTAALGVILLVAAVGVGVSGRGHVVAALGMLSYVFMLLGVTYYLILAIRELGAWRNSRDAKKRST
jgi:hypothetical protein